MPLALRDLQAAFATHILGGETDLLAGSVVSDSIAAAGRLRVHRHHVFDSLTTALATTFATVQALAGEDLFRTMARAHVARTPPAQPVLAEYGADFPAFIAGYGPARGLPWLADIGCLDWALNIAFQAPRADTLGVADLQAIPVEQLPAQRLALSPGHGLLRSSYPIDRIWAAAQPGAGGMADGVEGASISLLVFRREDDAAFVAIGPGEESFLAAIARGGTLEMAAAAALGADPGFDLSASFARFLGLGLFAALHQESHQREI